MVSWFPYLQSRATAFARPLFSPGHFHEPGQPSTPNHHGPEGQGASRLRIEAEVRRRKLRQGLTPGQRRSAQMVRRFRLRQGEIIRFVGIGFEVRSEEHTSELQSLR